MRPCLVVSLLTIAACSSSPPTPRLVRARVTADLGHILHETKNAATPSIRGLPSSFGLAPVAGLDPDAATSWLNENVFTDASSVGDGVFIISPELVCSTDQDCVQRLAAADLRVRVEQDDNGALRFAIQLDAAHDEPLSFLLSHDELAMAVDLDGATQAMLALAQLTGERAPSATLQGQATADLKILGPAHATASLTIDRALALAVADGGQPLAGDGALRFASPAAPVLAVELDGNAPLARLDLGLGETIAHLPGSAGQSTNDVDLAGLTGSIALDAAGTLAVHGFSLGDKTTTIQRGGVTARAIDLNPNDDRALAATLITNASDGTEMLTVSPRLDLQQRTDHSAPGSTSPIYDITRVQLDGSLAMSANHDAARVVGGSLSLTTSPSQYGFSATAGECVTATDALDATTGQTYTVYAIATCP
jgi:hypothetical protein